MGDVAGGDSSDVAPSGRKRRRDHSPGPLQLRRVAEIVLALATAGQLRGGGRVPTDAEKALAAEARSVLAAFCEESLKPGDLFGAEAVHAVVNDLGLRGLVRNDAGGNFLPSKPSVAEMLRLSEKKMKELDEASIVMSTHPVQSIPNVQHVNTGVHRNAFPNSQAAHKLSAGLAPNPVAPVVSLTPGSVSTTPLHMRQSQTTDIYTATSVHLRPSPSSSAILNPHSEASYHRSDVRVTGSTHMMQHNAVGGQAGKLPVDNTTRYEQNVVQKSNQAAKKQEMIYAATPKQQMILPATVKHEKILQVSQAGRVTTRSGHQLLQSLQYTQAHPGFSGHLDISRKVQQALQQAPSNPCWTPPPTDYMNAPIFCQVCSTIIADAESLLVCDFCERGTHLKCLSTFGSTEIPKLEWHCSTCLSSSNGKPLPPKYGKVTRSVAAAALKLSAPIVDSHGNLSSGGNSGPRKYAQQSILKDNSDITASSGCMEQNTSPQTLLSDAQVSSSLVTNSLDASQFEIPFGKEKEEEQHLHVGIVTQCEFSHQNTNSSGPVMQCEYSHQHANLSGTITRKITSSGDDKRQLVTIQEIVHSDSPLAASYTEYDRMGTHSEQPTIDGMEGNSTVDKLTVEVLYNDEAVNHEVSNPLERIATKASASGDATFHNSSVDEDTPSGMFNSEEKDVDSAYIIGDGLTEQVLNNDDPANHGVNSTLERIAAKASASDDDAFHNMSVKEETPSEIFSSEEIIGSGNHITDELIKQVLNSGDAANCEVSNPLDRIANESSASSDAAFHVLTNGDTTNCEVSNPFDRIANESSASGDAAIYVLTNGDTTHCEVSNPFDRIANEFSAFGDAAFQNNSVNEEMPSVFFNSEEKDGGSGQPASEHSVEWVDCPIQEDNERTYYNSCLINGLLYKLQSHVLVPSDLVKPIPSKLQSLWQEQKSGMKMAIVEPYVFPETIPKTVNQPSTAEDREVYATKTQMTITLASVLGPCEVLHFDKFKEASSSNTSLPDSTTQQVFQCRWRYDDSTSSFGTI